MYLKEQVDSYDEAYEEHLGRPSVPRPLSTEFRHARAFSTFDNFPIFIFMDVPRGVLEIVQAPASSSHRVPQLLHFILIGILILLALCMRAGSRGRAAWLWLVFVCCPFHVDYSFLLLWPNISPI